MPDNGLKDLIQRHKVSGQVNLFTPAHQGRSLLSDNEKLHSSDVYFLTRSRSHSVEQAVNAFYDTKKTFWLTGGSTQAVLIACTLLARYNKTVGIALNSHISVYNGLILTGLCPVFIPAKQPFPTTDEVITFLIHTKISALMLTAPSYDGKILNLPIIYEICRKNNITLVVDEAHGSHFPFIGLTHRSALHAADLVIHSLHKYVGGLVQTALLHIPRDACFDETEVLDTVLLFETTTRSNILLLSIEEAINYGASELGQFKYQHAQLNCRRLKNQIDHQKGHLCYVADVFDPLKIVLSSNRYSSKYLLAMLNEQSIDIECILDDGLLMMFSFNHTADEFEKVAHAIAFINDKLDYPSSKQSSSYPARVPEMSLSPKDAFSSKKRLLPLEKAHNQISSSYYIQVPPGIPVLIPGERITDWHLTFLPKESSINCIAS